MIKKILCISLALLICCFAFCSCAEQNADNEKLNIVCTMFPQYDWIKNLTNGNENANVTLLLDSGTDLHSYQPAAADIITISNADIFVYIGGDSDKWVADVLKTSDESANLRVSLSDLIKDELYCVEEIGEEEHNHSSEDEHSHAFDEHIWLSPKKALKICEHLKETLCEKDPDNKELYNSNFEVYKEKLSALDKSIETVVKEAKKDTIIVADRFPFLYLTKDYGLSYFAAFSGCSADSEASFETVKFLADKTDELEVSSIIISETADGSVANTVKNSTKNKNQKIVTLNSLQSVTKDKIQEGYIEVMTANLEILKEALS